MQHENDPFQGHSTLRLEGCFRICHFNCQECQLPTLSKFIREENVDIIALKETHTVDNADLH